MEAEWVMFKVSIVQVAVFMSFVDLEILSPGVSWGGYYGNMGMQGCW